jgi:hypothetical protein
MTKQLFFAISLLMFCITNYAQQCDDAMLDTLHGKWKTLIPGSIPSSITKSDVQKERLTMQGVTEIIRKNIPDMPISGNIGYGTFWESDDHRPTPIIKICDSYYTYISYMQFRCYVGKLGGDNDFGDASNFYTIFNDLPFRFDNSFYAHGPKGTDHDIDPLTDVYAILRSLPVVKDDYFDYIKADGSGNSTGNVSRYRTITKPGRLPYTVVNKKEYYEKWYHKYDVQIEDMEAQNEKFRKELAGSDQLEGMLKGNNQFIGIYQNYIDRINNILKTKSAEAIAQPAYEGEDLGQYFESRQADGCLRSFVVKPNFAYYNYTLKNTTAPQLITLDYKYYQDADAFGNKRYNCPKFYKSLQNMNIFDLLTEKLRLLIVL